MLFACKKDEKTAQTHSIATKSVQYNTTEIGSIIPAQTKVIASLAKGSILELKKHGEAVKKGDTLLRVSTGAVESKIAERKNGLIIDRLQEQRLKEEEQFILFEESEKVKLKKKQYETTLFTYQYKKSLPLATTVRLLEIDKELAEINLAETLESYQENKKLLDKNFITQTAFAPYERRVDTSKERLKEINLKIDIEKRGISKEELVELQSNTQRAKKEYMRAEIAKKRRLLDLAQRRLVVTNRIEKSLHEIAHSEEELENTTLTAQKDGGLFLRLKYRDWRSGGRYFHYSVGQDISRNSRVAEIIDETKMNIRILFNEADFRKFKEKQTVQIHIPAVPDKNFTGIISSISEVGKDRNDVLKTGQGKSEISLYSATVEFDPNGSKLHAGMTAQISIALNKKKQILALPRQALFIENGKQYVFLKDGLNSKKKKEIKATIADDFYLEIIEGLNEGDKILLNAKESL